MCVTALRGAALRAPFLARHDRHDGDERAVIQSHQARTFDIALAIRIVKNDAVILRERLGLRVDDHRRQQQAGEEKTGFMIGGMVRVGEVGWILIDKVASSIERSSQVPFFGSRLLIFTVFFPATIRSSGTV